MGSGLNINENLCGHGQALSIELVPAGGQALQKPGVLHDIVNAHALRQALDQQLAQHRSAAARDRGKGRDAVVHSCHALVDLHAYSPLRHVAGAHTRMSLVAMMYSLCKKWAEMPVWIDLCWQLNPNECLSALAAATTSTLNNCHVRPAVDIRGRLHVRLIWLES